MKDSPTNTSATVANYCTLNPLVQRWAVTGITFSEGNLKATVSSANNCYGLGTIFATSGKYYWEATVVSSGGAVGISDNQLQNTVFTNSVFYYPNGTKDVANVNTSYGATYTTNDIIGVALDCDAGTVTFYKNNTSQGAISISFGTVGLSAAMYISNNSFAYNFGQRPFSYTPPTGFVRLNTYNLPDSTIKKGNTVMDATLWTGTGGARTITNAAGFRPDWVWVKRRSSVDDHYSYDSVRGSNLNLVPNSTVAEANVTTYGSGGIGAATSTGFTIVAGTTNADNLNGSGITYVGWQWQAGQGSTSSNTSGSITSTVSVNTTAGFSIVTWTNPGTNQSYTVGHGLGVAPKMIILKDRGAANSWLVWHTNYSAASSNYLVLNSTAALATAVPIWGGVNPTSTTFGAGSNNIANFNSPVVAYCWAEIAGFSRFGSYTGNGSTDGPFIYLGFRPKFLMWKRTDTTSNWNIEDSYREAYNSATSPNELYANLSNAEGTNGSPIFLSNGFKLTSTGAGYNASGGTYIYMAFAENPFKNALAR
jgi:hypothetical protein